MYLRTYVLHSLCEWIVCFWSIDVCEQVLGNYTAARTCVMNLLCTCQHKAVNVPNIVAYVHTYVCVYMVEDLHKVSELGEVKEKCM